MITKGWFCPNCGSQTVVKLREKSKDYQRGMSHYCKTCNYILLILAERGN
jgi:predicted RNA-binding Zn-ribbon protein involved in translation (DUF1610 family)